MPKVAPQVAERGSNPSQLVSCFLLSRIPVEEKDGGATCCKDSDVDVLAAFCGAKLG